jgi:hypothetical protein
MDPTLWEKMDGWNGRKEWKLNGMGRRTNVRLKSTLTLLATTNRGTQQINSKQAKAILRG